MQSETRRITKWSIISLVLAIIGISGVPDDLETWRRWIQAVLNAINHGWVRFCFLAMAIVTFLLVFYPPHIRRQIFNLFRCGQVVDQAGTNPNEWNNVQGNPRLERIGNRLGVSHGPTTGAASVIEWPVSDVYSDGKIVWIRGKGLTAKITDMPPAIAIPMGITLTGSSFSLEFDVVRLRDQVTVSVVVQIDPRKRNPECDPGTHNWHSYTAFFEDRDGLENLVIDIDPILRNGYSQDEYKFVGIRKVEATVHGSQIVKVTLHKKLSMKHFIETFFSKDTWLPHFVN